MASTPNTRRLPRRISPSAIARYRQCPRAVWFQYIAQVPRRDRPSPSLAVGNAVHDALDKFFGLPVACRDPADEMLARCLRSVWARHRRPDTFETREEERDYGLHALELLSRFAAGFATDAVPVSRERWVSTRLANGVELFGKVDRLDASPGTPDAGPLTVTDYKTGRYQIDGEDLHREPAVQAYLVAVEDEYDREVDRVRYVYLESASASDWWPEREDVDAAKEALLDITTTMFQDTEFEAVPGEHCGRCPYEQVCPDAGRTDVDTLLIPDGVLF